MFNWKKSRFLYRSWKSTRRWFQKRSTSCSMSGIAASSRNLTL